MVKKKNRDVMRECEGGDYMYHDYKCYKCKYCGYIDYDGSVECKVLGKVQPRTGCSYYEPQYYKPSSQMLIELA